MSLKFKNPKLRALYNRMRRDDLPLKQSAKSLVFGQGSESAGLMFIGEAPGRKEDESGLPFCGAAGKELDRLLEGAGLVRGDVYITSILKYRPPNNRNPKKGEIDAHTPYLIRQIEIIAPRVLITLGKFSTEFLLKYAPQTPDLPTAGYMKACHGKFYPVAINKHTCQVMPSYHPAAILYNRKLSESVMSDFRSIQTFLNTHQ